MSPRMLPKTLAKTLGTITCVAPFEHGLFWNSDGTLPWKECRWVLQADPELRFVREATVRELELLGLDLPFTLQAGELRAKDPGGLPQPRRVTPPATLYCWVRRRQLGAVRRLGLVPDGRRSYIALFRDRESGRSRVLPRDPQPVLVTVAAERAHQAGVAFFSAGAEMILCRGVAAAYLTLPPLPETIPEPTGRRGQGSNRPIANGDAARTAPGSFQLGPEHWPGSDDLAQPRSTVGKKKGRGKGPDWKREARKNRRKREID